VDEADKLLNKWLCSTSEGRYDVVENFLLKAGFKKVHDEGSHAVFQHPLIKEAFKQFPGYFSRDFHPSGDLVIVWHNNKVKHWYLRNICKVLKYIQEIEEMKKDK
jgi:hypothetical protein